MRQNETERTIESRIAIETAGDSYWRESGSEIVSIHSITIREYDMDDEHYFDVYVRHDSEWTIYTDSGFERAISDAIVMRFAGRNKECRKTEWLIWKPNFFLDNDPEI